MSWRYKTEAGAESDGWRKGTRSVGNGECAECKEKPGGDVAVRDSTNREGPVLTIRRDHFVAATKIIKGLHVVHDADGTRQLVGGERAGGPGIKFSSEVLADFLRVLDPEAHAAEPALPVNTHEAAEPNLV
jgi:hypothetical protein